MYIMVVPQSKKSHFTAYKTSGKMTYKWFYNARDIDSF